MNYLAVLLAFVGNLSYLSAGNANADEILRIPTQSAENVSGPLILTSLIEDNKIAEARELAGVKPFLGCIRSYSGLLTVDKTYNSNMFFWFFPSERNPETAPVVVWLAGVYVSSFPGVFGEVGPYRVVDNDTIGLSNTSWTRSFSMLFIDNPLGVGYSSTNSSRGYSRDETEIGRNLYTLLVQFFAMFPEMVKNELFIAGASYGAKHAVACAYEIYVRQLNVKPQSGMCYDHPLTEPPKFKLTGVILLAAYCDPIRAFQYGAYLYQLGLVDARGRDTFQKFENEAVAFIKAKKYVQAAYASAGLIITDGTGKYQSLFSKLTGLSETAVFNILSLSDPILTVVAQLAQTAFVRNAVHVGNLTFGSGIEGQLLLNDTVISAVPQIETLIEKYKFLIAGGDLDAIVPFPVWDDTLGNLTWSGAPEYRNATRQIWKLNGDIVGYVKSANHSHLVFAWVRNAGHLLPRDQPVPIYELAQNALFDNPLDLTDVGE